MNTRTLLFSSIILAVSTTAVTAKDISTQSGIAVDTVSLFFPLALPAQRFANGSELIQQLEQDPSVSMLQLFDVNEALVDRDTEELRLNMGPDLDFVVHQDDSYFVSDDVIAWTGNIDVADSGLTNKGSLSDQFDKVNQVVLVKEGGRVYGEIYLEGFVYELSTTEDGTANILLQRNSEYALSIDDTPLTESPLIQDATGGTTDATRARRTIRVLQGASNAGVSAIGGRNRMRDRMSFHIAQSNQVMRNSGLTGSREVRFVSAGRQFPSGAGQGGSTATVRALANTRDGFLDAFATTSRNNTRADMVGYVTSTATGVCGQANQISSNANNPFFIVSVPSSGCPNSNGPVFLHEIGHLFGARHENDPTRTPFAFAHGFTSGNRVRTTMSFDVAFGANVVLFLSDPNRRVNGVNIGTSGFNDNERLFNQRATAISRYR